MKYPFYCFVIAICVAGSWGQDSLPPPPPPPSELNVFIYESEHPLKRGVRQSMLEPPESDKMTPPPPPDMPEFESHFVPRRRREARGVGGSMPTRKG